jgi:hypothetical protein
MSGSSFNSSGHIVLAPGVQEQTAMVIYSVTIASKLLTNQDNSNKHGCQVYYLRTDGAGGTACATYMGKEDNMNL